MPFTAAQRLAIRADIAANPDLSAPANNADGNIDVANLYNAPAVPSLPAWRSDASVTDIYDSIDFSKFTPVDTPEITGIYTARALAIQIKQMNLQNILQGRETVNATKATIRASLRDAVIAIPAGTAGANVAAAGASGVTLLTACTRPATRLEKLLTLGPQTTGTVSAEILGWEGQISNTDLNDIRSN